MSSSAPTVIPAPLSQGAGYGVVVGLGVAYAIGMHSEIARPMDSAQSTDISRHDACD